MARQCRRRDRGEEEEDGLSYERWTYEDDKNEEWQETEEEEKREHKRTGEEVDR